MVVDWIEKGEEKVVLAYDRASLEGERNAWNANRALRWTRSTLYDTRLAT
jgi:hypothetical protein